MTAVFHLLPTSRKQSGVNEDRNYPTKIFHSPKTQHTAFGRPQQRAQGPSWAVAAASPAKVSALTSLWVSGRKVSDVMAAAGMWAQPLPGGCSVGMSKGSVQTGADQIGLESINGYAERAWRQF